MEDKSLKKSNRPGRIETILTLILFAIIWIMIVIYFILGFYGFNVQILMNISTLLSSSIVGWYILRYRLFPRNKN